MSEVTKRLEYAVDLGKAIKKTYIDTLFATEDNAAHELKVTILRNGEAVELASGAAVTAYFMRYSDNATATLTGGVSGNVASVTLNKACYSKAGQFAIILKVAAGDSISTVFYGEGTMHISSTDAIIDEENVIPSLSELLAQIVAMEAATAAAKSATSDANSATKSANDAAQSAKAAAQGAQGWASATATATGLAAGSAPTVEVNTAEDGRKVIALGIPKGDKGDKGEPGEKGEKGEPGKDGTGAGTVTGVSVSGVVYEPDESGVVELGELGGGDVQTVNGVAPDEAGNVQLSAEDVGARAESWMPSASDVGALPESGTAADSSKLDGKTWAELLLEIYPVGSTYLSTNDTSPASLFGGTWERLKDRFLLGAGDSYTAGNTGGEATVKLTTGQLPAIRGQIHAGSGSSGTSGKGYGAFRAASGVFSAATEMQYGRPSESTSITWPSSAASYQYVDLSVGNGESHNNMPPYLAVYMWERVS